MGDIDGRWVWTASVKRSAPRGAPCKKKDRPDPGDPLHPAFLGEITQIDGEKVL